MIPLREFTFRNRKWHCRLEFFPDRIEYVWDKWGLGVEKTRTAMMRDALSPHLSEGTSTAGYAPRIFTRAGLLATIAIFSFALLPVPWAYIGYFFAVSTLISIGFGIYEFRKTYWISILKKDGDIAVGVQVTKWDESQREEFRTFFRSWIELNHMPEPRSGLAPGRGSS